MTRTYVIQPEAPKGYYLNEAKGFFSVIIPEETTNLILNPSFELGTTGYAVINGASFARSSTYQRRGAWGAAITPTTSRSGLGYTTSTLTSGTRYTFSLDLLGVAGVEYQLTFGTTGAPGTALATTYVRATGRWQRVSVSYTPTATAARVVALLQSAGYAATPFYTDGWQLEAKAYATTYCDGDQEGFVKGMTDFFWAGAPHAAASVRTSQTTAGGRIVNLDRFGFKVLAYIGLGMALLKASAVPNAINGGSAFQRSVPQDRPFSLIGDLASTSLSDLSQQRARLIEALRPDSTGYQQPIIVRYQQLRDDAVLGDEVEIPAVYTGGLEGQSDNNHQERLALSFTMFVPFIRASGETATILDYQDSISGTRILQRSRTGDWDVLGTGLSGGVALSMVKAGNYIYVGGSFTSAGGVANTVGIARWNIANQAWEAVGSGMDATSVYELAVGPDGITIYAAGTFTQAGGVANTAGIAKWDGSSWSAMGTGVAGGGVLALAVGSQGKVYATGTFTSAGGVASTSKIARWSGSAWESIGVLNNQGNALTFGKDGVSLYAGGFFTTAGGVSASFIAKYNTFTSTWSAVGDGTVVDAAVTSLATGLDGVIYATGTFVAVSDEIVGWNGSAWSTFGGGITGGFTRTIKVDQRSGALFAAGTFTGADDLTLPDPFVGWNGSRWAPLDIDLGSTSEINALLTTPGGTLYIGGDATTTVTAAGQTTVTNNGSSAVAPTLRITGPGTLYSLTNYTTGKQIQFYGNGAFGLQVLSGEILTLTLDPQRISFMSTFRGDMLGSILRGSDTTSWRLHPGANIVSLLISGSTTAATEAALIWRESYWSVDASIPKVTGP